MKPELFNQLKNADIFEAFGELGELLETKVDRHGLASLSAVENQYYCIYWFILLMDTGGYGQYHLHHMADHNEVLISALHSISAPEHAQLLQATSAAYPEGLVPRSFDIRLTELEKNEEQAMELFKQVGERFYECEEFLIELLMDYAFRNAEYFEI